MMSSHSTCRVLQASIHAAMYTLHYHTETDCTAAFEVLTAVLL